MPPFNPWALPVQSDPLTPEEELMMEIQGGGPSRDPASLRAPNPQRGPRPAPSPLAARPIGPTQPQIVTPPSPEKIVDAQKAAKTLLGLPDAPPRPSQQPINPSPGWYVADLEQSIKDKLATTDKSNVALDEDQYQTVKDRLNKQEIQALKDQSQGVDTSLRLAKDFTQIPVGLDLSAIGGLVDYENAKKGIKTNLAAQYKAPTAAREMGKENLAVVDAVQKQRGQFSKEQVDLLKANLQGYRTEQVLRDIQDKLSQGNKPPAPRGNPAVQQSQFDREYRAKLAPVLADLNASKEQFGIIDSALASRDYASINLTLAQLARRVSGEKGVLTDQDVKRVMPSNFQGDVAKFMTYLNGVTPTTVVPPEYAKSLQGMVELAKQRAREKYEGQVKSLEGIYRPDPKFGGTAAAATQSARSDASAFAPPTPKKKSLVEQFMEAKKAGAIPAGNPAAPAAPPKKKSLLEQFQDAKKGS